MTTSSYINSQGGSIDRGSNICRIIGKIVAMNCKKEVTSSIDHMP